MNTRNTNPRRFMQPQIPLELANLTPITTNEGRGLSPYVHFVFCSQRPNDPSERTENGIDGESLAYLMVGLSIYNFAPCWAI